MGNCFSHGKGRPPLHTHQATVSNPSTLYKDKEENHNRLASVTCYCDPLLNGPSDPNPPHSSSKFQPEAVESQFMISQQLTSNMLGRTSEITWDSSMGESNVVASNGNTEPVPRERPQRATVYAHRITRTNSEPSKSSKAVLESKVNALFENYRETTEDVILADGIERLCADLCLSPDEFRVLVLAWKFDASQMCQFTRKEFVDGCRNMHVDTLKGIQNKLPEIVSEVEQDGEKFKDLYRFTFRFGLDSGEGQRILPSDMAVLLWRLVFSVREPPILSRWLRFLDCHPHVRGIPRDTWNMFLNFADAVGNDLSTYDDAEAWPSIFDDFVEFENDQTNQNVTAKEKDNNIISNESH